MGLEEMYKLDQEIQMEIGTCGLVQSWEADRFW